MAEPHYVSKSQVSLSLSLARRRQGTDWDRRRLHHLSLGLRLLGCVPYQSVLSRFEGLLDENRSIYQLLDVSSVFFLDLLYYSFFFVIIKPASCPFSSASFQPHPLTPLVVLVHSPAIFFPLHLH